MFINAIIITITNSNIQSAAEKMTGLNTQNQFQLITLHNFRTMKTIVSNPENPRPPPVATKLGLLSSELKLLLIDIHLLLYFNPIFLYTSSIFKLANFVAYSFPALRVSINLLFSSFFNLLTLS